MATLTTQQMYDDASAALHKLRMGMSVVSVTDQNGEKVTFNAASVPDLQAYVQQLGEQLGMCSRKQYTALKFYY